MGTASFRGRWVTVKSQGFPHAKASGAAGFGTLRDWSPIFVANCQCKIGKQKCPPPRNEVKAFYGIIGAEYDTIFILEAPDDEAVGKMAMAIGVQGNVRTSAHRVFSEEEFKRIISGLP